MAAAEDIWVELELEGFNRVRPKIKGKKPVVKFRNYFNNDLPAADRARLVTLMPQYAQIQAAQQQREDQPLAIPQDQATLAELTAFETAAAPRQAAMRSDLQCILDIITFGEQYFLHQEGVDFLNERRQELENELQQFDQQAARPLANLQQRLADEANRGAGPVNDGVAPGGASDAQEGATERPAADAAAQDPLNAEVDALLENAYQEERAIFERERNRRHRLGQLNEGWWRAEYLGEGAYGSAYSWVKQNEHGMIIDRLATKDSRAEEGVRRWDRTGLILMEVFAMMRLRPLRGSESIVRIRNWRISWPERLCRIYMEYCPFNSMQHVLSEHYRTGYGTALYRRIRFIPEPFVWFFFETLAKAGILMERGDLEKRGNGYWQLINHRDVKHRNIFLGLNDTDTFKGYHMPKLGDFGLCVMSDDGVRSEEVATFGYRFHAPEARADQLEGATGESWLTAATNVWEIALSVYSLMIGDEYLDDLIGSEDRRERIRVHYRTHRVPRPFDAEEMKHYSEDLRTLVMDCLKYLPNTRPTFDDVLKRLSRRTGYGSQDGARGLRHAPANDPQFARYGLLLKREGWPMRSMLAAEPRNPPPPGGPPRPPRRKPKPKDGDGSDADSDDSLGGQGRMYFDPARLTPAAPPPNQPPPDQPPPNQRPPNEPPPNQPPPNEPQQAERPQPEFTPIQRPPNRRPTSSSFDIDFVNDRRWPTHQSQPPPPPPPGSNGRKRGFGIGDLLNPEATPSKRKR
ncbi:hypothetical protein M409DRAFT_19833 [Zasmidium cellare ATCC 36951]|uniref:non-specific serine/threonine protein kinase n=1 Tax=Zasmidium cellare ATCC 36951 TaxID=1080233 RepID=A0A6A6CT05_ZASCE|nr:uncharacterized protein M409DRAFT_19833 [Zasmidium cellare ATCC 36951]KAF2170231.1 hypothetical protein M409DRAFT_19833 [Zasmidium cellare ATCC 36951]